MRGLKLGLGLAVASAAFGANANAATLFSQDFSSSAVVGDYVDPSTPTTGQFNQIATSGAGVTVAISSGTLTFTRANANTGVFSRTTDLSPVPDLVSYKLTLATTSSAAGTTAGVFQVGSGFGTGLAAESNANTYARFAVDFGATSGQFAIRDITNGTVSSTLSGSQNITWILNNTGGSQSYINPSAVSSTIANDTADIYAGTTLLFDDVPIQTASQSITDLKFAMAARTGSISIDNIQIDSLPVPEPASATVLVGLVGLLGLRRRH